MSNTIVDDVLNLRVGDWVEVKRAEEIAKTLDSEGKLESLPFMFEMEKFCGQRFRVFKRAEKVCDTIDKKGLRRMRRSVILDGAHCDGASHGGCQAGCPIFWKEAWLRRVEVEAEWAGDLQSHVGNGCVLGNGTGKSHGDAPHLIFPARVSAQKELGGEETYSCQITEIKKATIPIHWWDVRVYVRDVTSGNVPFGRAIRGFLILLFNKVQDLRGGMPFPYVEETAKLRVTPKGNLNLQPGELVRVKTKEEIFQTLDANYKNRGLWFDVEMLKHCGKQYRVRHRVERLIEERTGRLRKIPNDCVVLSGVVCQGECHEYCARSEFLFWREVWLERVQGHDVAAPVVARQSTVI